MMDTDVFDRETLLDLTVNAIPLGIILFFVVLFVAYRPWTSAPVETVIQMMLMLGMFFGLLVLSYHAGRAISVAENEMEAETEPPVADPVEQSTTPAENRIGEVSEPDPDATDVRGAEEQPHDADATTDDERA